MGHANLQNISQFVLKQVHDQGMVTLADLVDGLQQAGEKIHTSEGDYDDKSMLRDGAETVLRYYYNLHYQNKNEPLEPILIPADVKSKDIHVLQQWQRGDTDDWKDGEDGEYTKFDQIKWKFGPGWRERYDTLPLLRHIEE